MKKIVFIGGWGHWHEVAGVLVSCDGIVPAGIAPAYAGENLDGVCSHPGIGDVPVFDSMDALFDQVDADIATVSSRPGNIAAAVIRAADAGSDVIAEKPMGITFEETDAIAEAIHKNDRRLMAMFSLRAQPVFQTARRLVQEGAIGRPVLVNARKSYKFGDEKKRPAWFGERSVYGGTFPWVGIHALDLILFTTGLQMRQVAAIQKNLTHPSLPACEDSCCGIFGLDGDAMATVSIDYFRPGSAATHGDDWIRIVGTDGVVEARANEGLVTLLKDGTAPEPVPLDDAMSLYVPFLTGDEGLTNSADALSLSRACLCARQAADENRIIEIV